MKQFKNKLKMTTSYYKSVRNYERPQSSKPVHVPQPFLNYGGLSQMLRADYQNPIKETVDIKPSVPLPATYTRVTQPRAMSARQRFEQNQKMQLEREKKLFQRAILNKTNPNAVEEAQNTYWMTHTIQVIYIIPLLKEQILGLVLVLSLSL